MMKLHLPCLLIAFILLSCSSPQKSYKNGNYSKAYRGALKKLDKDGPRNPYRTILINSLTKILKVEELEAKNLQKSDALKDKESAYKIYINLQDKIEESQDYTLDKFNAKHIEYEEKSESLKDYIGREYFNLGNNNLEDFEENNLKSKAKLAHSNYVNAQRYDFYHADLDSLINYALESAILIYVIEPDFPFGTFGSFGLNNILDDLEDEGGSFINVIYKPSSRITADCYIELEIESVDFSTSKDSETKTFEEEIHTESDTFIVKGTVVIETITRTAKLDIRVDPNGNQNCNLFHSNLSESLVEEIENFSISGDERAIPNEYKGMNFDADFKSENDVFEELLRQIYPEIERAIF